jgi:hypothetical protein
VSVFRCLITKYIDFLFDINILLLASFYMTICVFSRFIKNVNSMLLIVTSGVNIKVDLLYV